MKTIWKYPLDVREEQVIEAPMGANLLSVQVQDGAAVPCIWALVNPDEPRVKFVIRTIGTGEPIPDWAVLGHFIGTYQLLDGILVYHVFYAGMLA